MQQLTGLDAAFLAMESRTTFGHVGSVEIVDPSTAPQPLTLENFTRVIESRLALVPALRRRLVEVPFGLDQPYWIEDPDFDIEFHVRELALPAPGNDRQLADQVARLHARPLDRTRPLWEMYLIHGLEGGLAANYSKVHHAAIDGVSGNEIIAVLLDLSSEGRELPELPPRAVEEPPSQVELFARSAVSLAGHPMRALRMTAGLARSVPALVTTNAPRLPLLNRFVDTDRDVILSQPGLRAPDTPFNRPITQHRRWAFCDVPLSGVKKIKNAAGVTVNDVVMALCAGALRRWLDDHDALDEAPLIAGVPISVRTEEEKGTGGNRVSVLLAALPTNLADPADRLRDVHQAMRIAKEQHDAIPANLLADVSQFAAPALAGQAWRLAARLRLMQRVNPFNLVISNVPGPNVPLYIAGAELVAYYPLSAITDGQGLNITVFSYRDSIFFGLIACRELVPDLDSMARYVEEEFDVLSAADLAVT
jgi:diacylglycerol O-acyltransferase / wax synthase